MKLPGLAHNRLSYLGALIAILATSAGVFLLLFAAITGGDAPYGALIVFLMLPAVFGVGVLLIGIGMWRERRHVARTGRPSIERFPTFDLNDPGRRLRLVVVAMVGIFLLFGVNFASYLAYEHTESVAFCGQTCHVAMEPEAVAHRHSPHAETTCVACHVGPGGEAFVRSKVSGLHQVYVVLTDAVPRPIPVPIDNLRPARETCQACHWPQQFFVPQYRRLVHFLGDEANTPWEIHLQILTGGGGPSLAGARGIHAHHSGVLNTIEYVPSDPARNEIPWVRITDNASGLATEYLAEGATRPDEAAVKQRARVMDCIDCHNRPAHRYHPPGEEVDQAMALGTIDPTLPAIKATAVKLLSAEYATPDEAVTAITSGLETFYRTEHPDVMASRADDVAWSAHTLTTIYRRNFFPLMKVRWDTYPDHRGHVTSPGCFRCHDGKHVTASGDALTSDCRSCHLIMAQGSPGALEWASGPDGLEFRHPGDVGDLWQSMACADCHTGGPS